jgi:hypothetical protein
MVVKKTKRKKITKRKKTTTRRKNPTLSIPHIKRDIEFEIKPLSSGKSLVTVKYLNQKIDSYVIDSKMINYVQTKGKDLIAEDIQKILERNKVRTNPDGKSNKPTSEEKAGKMALGSVGLPETPREAWLAGYDQGLKYGISLCGLTDFFRRREIREELASRTEKHFDDFAQQMRASGRIIGAKIPRIR